MAAWKHKPVPDAAMRLYRICWQIETWLRTIIYVELKSFETNWFQQIEKQLKDHYVKNDKQLHHMSTIHQPGLSYLSFSELWKIISQEDQWPRFEPYFPPLENTSVRIKEVMAIRNRVAHFRHPHAMDIKRLVLFADDLDRGVHRFLERYRSPLSPAVCTDDPVCRLVSEAWDDKGWRTEMQLPQRWLYASPPYRETPSLNASLELMSHSGGGVNYPLGIIYQLNLSSNSKQMDLANFLEQTSHCHEKIIHIFGGQKTKEFSVTIPAILGADEVTETILRFLSVALDCCRFSNEHVPPMRSDALPEFVILDDQLMSFYDGSTDDRIILTR